MDPGLGLVVNSMVPNEVEVPKPPPKPPLLLPKGFLEKPHVRHALKYMTDDEQREKALEVALAWKKKFAAGKWKPVVAAIAAASKEDTVRSPPHDAHLHESHTTVHPVERPRAMTTASAPAIPQITSPLMPGRTKLARLRTTTASLPLRYTPAPSTPRTYRWDLMPTGPVTPLSPTPMGNAFSGGGFWENSATQTEQHEMPTPIPEADDVPVSPIVLADVDAREVYVRVKSDIDGLTRKYCLARHHMRLSLSEDDVFPAGMIKPRDMMQAAEASLHCRKVKLKKIIVKDLPDILQSHAKHEAALRRQLCIKNEVELSEQNDWMNDESFGMIPENLNSKDYKPPAHLAVSILDEQREAIRMFRTQRNSSELELEEVAIEAAWAVRIMEDAERLMASETDGSSSGGDDDDGYSYGNFLRSIKSEMSTSTSSGALASMVEELSNSDLTSLRSRANTHQTVSSTRSRDFRFAQRSSTSPNRDIHPARRSREAGVSDSSHKHVHSLQRHTDLRISTEIIDEVPSAELSPEDREYRHRGPNLVDLDHWAEELRKMEIMRAERQRSPTLHRRSRTHTTETGSSTHQHAPAKRMSVGNINTRIAPARQPHSRFSSSSSSSETMNMSNPLSRSTFPNNPPSYLRSTRRLTMLDHKHHQSSISKASTGTHQHRTSKASSHTSPRRNLHVRSASSVHILTRGSTKEDEDAWMRELEKMESRERTRQSCERRRTSQILTDQEGRGGCAGGEAVDGSNDEDS
ncbi:hypothetical protein EKO04_006888 [Ascochyta lentis]|uniref:Uncharacterized protein n=1 Tax=Ascochyta lentis TaxID=205686 RepID=A0A8H7IY71_9PLEO|nr:hypothetical protein EKO04_006888 [Ascochyta lentis]